MKYPYYSSSKRSASRSGGFRLRSNDKKWRWYVYIVECLDSTYYTGCTWNILTRIEQHASRRGSKYTGKHGFKKLVYYEEHDNLESARKREIQIKGWSQKKKQKLISGEWKRDY